MSQVVDEINTYLNGMDGFQKKSLAKNWWAYPKELSLAEVEKKHIMSVLAMFKGNRTHAANALRISLRGLRNKLTQYKLSQRS
jgi:DNA-binding protein Fis